VQRSGIRNRLAAFIGKTEYLTTGEGGVKEGGGDMEKVVQGMKRRF